MSAARRLSLKGRALRYLAQREHSRAELRRKLLPYAVEACAASHSEAAVSNPGEDGESVDPGPCLDKLLEWLEANGLLSQERFTEGRIRVRAPRFGVARISHELAQHGVSLHPEQRAELEQSEFERAYEAWRRKFGGGLPADERERARQGRFLQSRGFSPDVCRRILRGQVPAQPD